MLRYRADLRTIAFMGVFFALVAVQWLVPAASIFDGGAWWAAAPLFVLTCFFSFFCAVATHNTIHSPVFEKRAHNRVFQTVLTLTYGHPVSAFVPGHNLSHHKHTQTRKDVMRTSKTRFSWNLLNGLFFIVKVAPAIMRGESLYFKTMKERLPAWYRQYQIEFWVLHALYLALFIADWKKALVFVFLPHKYAAWGIVTMNLLQHDGADENSEYNHSRNFVGKLVNWFTFNNGFHTIHHVHPGMHWSLTPEAHAREIAPHIHPALDQKSLLAYIVRTYLWPGKRLTYLGQPVVLPEEGPDENWVPKPEETKEDLGAMAPA
ncbi:MAG: fatty acid desaturase [Polyangiaceae bacterium]|jgi:fatty acid desaturase|nr:fatty acid desaturase [Polyangiaceae bacterium]MBK8936458.1 fatty acid desaturase [Polyangiaceae bacterium]